MVQNNITRPTPIKTPAFGVHQIRVNQAENGFGSRTLSFKTATELGFQQVEKPNPRAMANRMARMGMIESRVLYVSADALFKIRP